VDDPGDQHFDHHFYDDMAWGPPEPGPAQPKPKRYRRHSPQDRRHRRKLWLLAFTVILAAIAAPLIVAVTLVLILGNVDRPAAVPAGYKPPPALPRAAVPLAGDNLVFDSNRGTGYQVFAMRTNGEQPRPLTEDPAFDSWSPRLSPDRRTVLFYRTPQGVHDRDPSAASLWAMAADGISGTSPATQLRPAGYDGWTIQAHAEWSPDGLRLIMTGGSRLNPQIHVTDALGQGARAVTDRPGPNLDPSFTPDGTELLFVGCPKEDCSDDEQEVFRKPVDGPGDALQITFNDRQDRNPQPSPDGLAIVWETHVSGGLTDVWDLELGDKYGNGNHRLINDDGISRQVRWSTEGATLFFQRKLAGKAAYGLWAIGRDGLRVRELTIGQTGNSEYPSP
jgi:hypothetical protein